uniref:Uncharacterized protein n=1 Tax=Anguilla anguilla TaxID=7936 RepID=A0A0E9QI17_ANGAN
MVPVIKKATLFNSAYPGRVKSQINLPCGFGLKEHCSEVNS